MGSPSRITVMSLRNRYGEVVGNVVIDATDAEWANRWTWYLSGGYARRRRGNAELGQPKNIYLHRAIMGCVPGDGVYVDHINRDRLDCRRANLRIVTPQEAAQNKPALTGRYRGVCWDRNRQRWMAHAQLNGRTHFIGRFRTEDEAARAAEAWRQEHMPFSVEGVA